MIRQASEHQGHPCPLIAGQRVAVPEGRDEDGHELPRCRDGCVDEGTELVDGEEDEVLAHCAAQAEDQHVHGGLRVSDAEAHRVHASATRPREHVGCQVDCAPQVHPHHEVVGAGEGVPEQVRNMLEAIGTSKKCIASQARCWSLQSHNG